MTEQEAFIKNLSILLEESDITQRELAENVEVTEVTISRYLSGERSPRIEIVTKIANFFNVTTDFLLGRTETRNPIYKEDDIQIAFSNGFAGLNEENKKLALDIIAGIKAKQDFENK